MRRLSVPDVGFDTLQVWALDLDLESAVSDADWSALSANEQQKALRYRLHADRVRAVATRAALRRLLARQLSCPPTAVAITQTPLGKPVLVGSHDIGFNVSHSGCHALIALCRAGAVGIDIEHRTDTVDVASLASLVLTRMERDETGEPNLGFFDRWVVKEAVLKALGLGITDYLQAFSVFLGDGQRLHLTGHADWPPLRACRLQMSTSYAAAVAATEHLYDADCFIH